MEQPVLRPETGSALGLQGRQEFWPRRDVSWRGAVVPRRRPLGGPHQLQEEEARLQTAVSVPGCKDAVTGDPRESPRTLALRGHPRGSAQKVSVLTVIALFCLQPWRRQRVLVPVQRRGECKRRGAWHRLTRCAAVGLASGCFHFKTLLLTPAGGAAAMEPGRARSHSAAHSGAVGTPRGQGPDPAPPGAQRHQEGQGEEVWPLR